jgi:hypothetical protein
MARMSTELEGGARTGPVGQPPSCGKDELPNSELRTSQINLVLVKDETKVSGA